MSVEMLKITQVKSRINRKKDHKATLDALGISRMHQTVYHEDTACLRGMVRKVRYMVEVEVVDVEAKAATRSRSRSSSPSLRPSRRPRALRRPRQRRRQRSKPRSWPRRRRQACGG